MKLPQQLSGYEIVLGMTVTIQTPTEMFLAFPQGCEKLIANQVPAFIKGCMYFLNSQKKCMGSPDLRR